MHNGNLASDMQIFVIDNMYIAKISIACFTYFLNRFRMYTSGLNPRIQEIYPPITYPVSRGTPSIQSLPFWDHNDQWIPQVTMSSHVNALVTYLYHIKQQIDCSYPHQTYNQYYSF